MEAKEGASKLLRILMLHGYRQNEFIFKDKTGGLRKNLKKLADLVYCEALLDVPKDSNGENADLEGQVIKGWFLKTDNVPDPEGDFEKTLDHVNKIFEEKGPFDGIWGFSQGATVAAILCNIITNNYLSSQPNRSNIKFKFAIISATGKSSQSQLDKYYDQSRKIDLPTLHIIGKTDKLTQYEKSLEHIEYFLNPKIYVHELGHFIPAKKDDIAVYSEFLNEMRDRFLNKN